MAFIQRQLKLPKNQNFFLFGARNTGKSTLIRKTFDPHYCLWIDLLDPLTEERYMKNPSLLEAEVLALDDTQTHVVIDEIQKIPKLLDMVHKLIEQTSKKFILTGSSARKLRHGGANLLAGRAFVYHLFPFTSFELGKRFSLDEALQWGSLPAICSFKQADEKMRFLQAYSQSYLREEIWIEQFVRKLDPFRKFLEVAAQCNGKIVNFSKVARDVGVDSKTIQTYFSILEDTLIGFFLEPFQHSFRKRLSAKPKFYYFDVGVARSLARVSSIPLKPATSVYGDVFEHFVVVEILRLSSYYFPDYRFSYLKTKDDAEVDLIVERPGKKILFIEIKSSTEVIKEKLTTLAKLADDFGASEALCFSRDSRAKRFGHVTVYPWQQGVKKYFCKDGMKVK